jgi:hypothetical protein
MLLDIIHEASWYDLAVQILKEHKLTNPIAPSKFIKFHVFSKQLQS